MSLRDAPAARNTTPSACNFYLPH
ncbi:uncharacterized protein METZ01_LOCUS236787, partial [marine metagenome]